MTDPMARGLFDMIFEKCVESKMGIVARDGDKVIGSR